MFMQRVRAQLALPSIKNYPHVLLARATSIIKVMGLFGKLKQVARVTLQNGRNRKINRTEKSCHLRELLFFLWLGICGNKRKRWITHIIVTLMPACDAPWVATIASRPAYARR